MKTFLFLLLCGMTFCFPFKNKPVSTNSTDEAIATVAVAPIEPVADTISFSAQIQPILQNRCSPCHFSGGKMYEKMPFDQAATIVGHPEGVLKRIKDKKESALFRQFFAQSGK